MLTEHSSPWEPDRRWADPFIATLALLILCLLGWRAALQHRYAPPPAQRASAQARMAELKQAAGSLAPWKRSELWLGDSFQKLADRSTSPWDRALYSVLAAENHEPELGRSLAMDGPLPAGKAGPIFRQCYAAAYLSQGAPPEASDRAEVTLALRNGFAARLLEARLQDCSGRNGQPLREEARAWALPRLIGLGLVGILFVLMVPAGLTFALVLLFLRHRPSPRPMPRFRLSGRALAIVLLGWFLALLLSGLVVSSLLVALPFLRPLALPMTYVFHAAVGLGLLCRAEGLTLSAFWHRLTPGSRWGSLAWGLGFMALAMAAVLAVSVITNPFLKSQEPPQRELMDLVAGTHGPLAVAMLFLTASVVAPLFEESLFRGTVLPWLGARLEPHLGSAAGWTLALGLTALAFGAIHLQPAALPAISALGLVLGLAFLHTRNLWTSVLVHGLWNGGVFLFYRMVLA